MTITRIIETAEVHIERELFDQVLEGEDVNWDVTVLPGDQKAPFAFITMAMNGALLGTKVQVGVFVPNPAFVGATEAKDIVTSLLEVLRRQRSEQLPPQGQLIIPGAA